jgi:hypothetical protein
VTTNLLRITTVVRVSDVYRKAVALDIGYISPLIPASDEELTKYLQEFGTSRDDDILYELYELEGAWQDDSTLPIEYVHLNNEEG